MCSPKAIIDLILTTMQIITRLNDIVLWPLSCITDATQGYPVSTSVQPNRRHVLWLPSCSHILECLLLAYSTRRRQTRKIVSLCPHVHKAKKLISWHRCCDSWAGRRRRGTATAGSAQPPRAVPQTRTARDRPPHHPRTRIPTHSSLSAPARVSRSPSLTTRYASWNIAVRTLNTIAHYW